MNGNTVQIQTTIQMKAMKRKSVKKGETDASCLGLMPLPCLLNSIITAIVPSAENKIQALLPPSTKDLIFSERQMKNTHVN
jgi:hypothetical protein